MKKTGVEYVRETCKEKGISVHKLEKDLGFANGYLNPKKLKKIPYERAVLIANYLRIPADNVLGGVEKPKEYYLDPEVSRIAQELHDNYNLRILFDATRKATPEDLQMIVDIAKRIINE